MKKYIVSYIRNVWTQTQDTCCDVQHPAKIAVDAVSPEAAIIIAANKVVAIANGEIIDTISIDSYYRYRKENSSYGISVRNDCDVDDIFDSFKVEREVK